MNSAANTAVIDVGELDLPMVEPRLELSIDERNERADAVAGEHWLARSTFGYMVLQYDDVVAVLRDKRWHSATSMIPDLMGVTDPTFRARRRTSILSAEGDEHVRPAPPRRQGVLATISGPPPAVHARGHRRPRRRRRRRRAMRRHRRRSATRIRSPSSASCSAPRPGIGSCSPGWRATSSRCSTRTCPTCSTSSWPPATSSTSTRSP
ncbi:MAG: hypothetical protein WKF58_19475 [Ilumatobacteraceae bacterium]